MQAYGAAFAKVYNQLWGDFAQQTAPLLHTFYEATSIGCQQHSLLDVCCGTGVLAVYFLEHGYRVVGLDLSAAMLEYAEMNTQSYTEAGLAEWVQADAAGFVLTEQFGLAVSTFDALNHLPNLAALQGCFESVYRALLTDGWFIFDLNTRSGLKTRWNGVQVQDREEYLLIQRSICDETMGRGLTQITGFWKADNGLYERFEEVVYNTIFDLQTVQKLLFETGFQSAYFARRQDLTEVLQNPEDESRVFIIAHK